MDAISGDTQRARSHEELVDMVVQYPDMTAAVIYGRSLTGAQRRLIQVLHSRFPLLAIVLVTRADEPAAAVEGVMHVDIDAGDRLDEVRHHLQSIDRENKRRHQRFDRPFAGHLTVPGHVDSDLTVRSISCSGAYLVAPELEMEPGEEGTIQLVVGDLEFTAGCRIVGRRESSDDLPAGFGVEFLDLPERTREMIDNIVESELRQSLLNSA